MNSLNCPRRPRKLVDYTKDRGNHHLCANNNVSTTTTKPFPLYEHHSHKAIPSMLPISASNLDTQDTNHGCASEGPDRNDFRIEKVSTGRSRRRSTSDLRERFQSSRSLTCGRQPIRFKRATTVPEDSVSSLDAPCIDPASVEPIDFLLKFPQRTQRGQRSDLRERFQSRGSQFLKKCSIIQPMLSPSSTSLFASRRLPSINSDNFGTIEL